MTKPMKTDFGTPPSLLPSSENTAPPVGIPSSENDTLSVSALAQKIKNTIEDKFGRVRVRGEIGRVSRPSSGHIYLDLKDDKAVLSAVIWKGQAALLAHKPEEGMEAICTGRLTTFGQQSRYQLVIDDLAPAGKGALMALIEERRKKLAALGLFDRERKRPLPFLPERIGVITSPSGAVIRDILHRLDERFGREVLVWGVRVQGAQCGSEVVAALDGFNAMEKATRPDLLIVARGGGSVEDLQGFNEEAVVQAAARSSIPIISAIGHETDHTLLDLVADKRAPTPTAAAEMSVPVRLDLSTQMQTLSARASGALSQTVKRRAQKLEDLQERLARVPEFIYRLEQRVDDLTSGLPAALKARVRLAAVQLRGFDLTPPVVANLKEKIARVRQAGALLDALSYQKILARGFTLVFDQDNRLVARAANTKIGQHLKIEFAAGKQIAVERIGDDTKTKQGKLFDVE